MTFEAIAGVLVGVALAFPLYWLFGVIREDHRLLRDLVQFRPLLLHIATQLATRGQAPAEAEKKE